LAFFSPSTPPTLPSPGRKLAQKIPLPPVILYGVELPNKKIKLTNIPPRKKMEGDPPVE
jgi:hypothetical protein